MSMRTDDIREYHYGWEASIPKPARRLPMFPVDQHSELRVTLLIGVEDEVDERTWLPTVTHNLEDDTIIAPKIEG